MTDAILRIIPRGWGYVRVSTTEQYEHASSIAAQIATIIQFAESRGIDLGPVKIVRVNAKDGSEVEIESRERIVIEAVSAYKTMFLKRPVAGELYRQHLKPGDHLIFAKMDRAFCNTQDMLSMLERFIHDKIRHYYLDQGSEAYQDTAAAEAQLTILTAIARMERRRKSERHREAFEARRQQGRRKCWVPCWYSAKINGERQWKYEPKEREIQKKIYHWYYEGYCIEEITVHLRSLGVILLTLDETQIKRYGNRPNWRRVLRMLAAEHWIRSIAKDMGRKIDDPIVLEAHRDRWCRGTNREVTLLGFTRGGAGNRALRKTPAVPLAEPISRRLG